MINFLPPAPAGWAPSQRRRLTVDEVERLGGYTAIYSDPPWPYDNTGDGVQGRVTGQYHTATIPDLRAMPVSRLAAASSVLFMWATWPFLGDALVLMTHWGFNYSRLAFIWVKYRGGTPFTGLGYWTRSNTELCLFGVRGNPRPQRQDAAVSQLVWGEELGQEGLVLHAPLTRHSAKPPEVRQRIVRLMGDVPRLELFARERADGFDAWGDEVDSDIIMRCGQ